LDVGVCDLLKPAVVSALEARGPLHVSAETSFKPGKRKPRANNNSNGARCRRDCLPFHRPATISLV
jgi:hypothetical protein